MSLYDEAAVALIAEGAAGKDGKLYNIKPELEVYPEELTTNGDFSTPGTASTSSWSLGWAVSVSSEGDAVISGGKLTLTNAGAEDRADAYMTDGSSAFFDLLDGGTYYVTYNVTDNSDGAASVLRVYAGSTNSYVASTDLGPQSVVVTQSGSDESLIFQMKSTDASLTISNISVKRVKQAPLDFTFTRGSNLTATRVAPSGYIEKGRENLITHSNDFSEWGVNTAVYNAPTTGYQGYDGSTNAWLIDRIATDNSYVAIPNNPKLSYSGVFTWSIYAKNESGTDNGFLMYTEVGQARFDLTGDGAVLNDSGVIDSNIEKLTNGWFRCSFTASGSIDADANGTPRFRVEDLSNNNALGKIYVQDSQIEAGLVATEYIESGITTGEAGILEDSPRFDYTGGGCPHLLMEPTRINLINYTEYFGASWTTDGTATITTNNTTSPEGVKNATLLDYGATHDGTSRLGKAANIDASTAYTFSVFAKKKNATHIGLRNFHSGNDSIVTYNLDTQAASANANVDSTDVVDYGNGWYRLIMTFTSASDDTAADLRIGAPTSDVGSGDEVYIYGAQLEKGAYATSYIPNHGALAGSTRNDDVTDAVDFGDYMDGEDITWYVELAKNDELIRDGSTAGIRLSTTDLNASSVKFYRSYAGAPDGIRTVVYFADDENDNDPASHEITEAGPVKVIVRRVKSTGEFTIFYDGAQKHQKFAPANYGKLKTLKIDGEKQPLFINNMFLFDRALTDDECIALTT